MKKRIVCFLCLFLLIGLLPGCGPTQTVDPEKPVIYLYPEEETEVTVKLDYNGTIDLHLPRLWGRLDGDRPARRHPHR